MRLGNLANSEVTVDRIISSRPIFCINSVEELDEHLQLYEMVRDN